MYFNGAISHLDGWHILTTNYEVLLKELNQLINDIELPSKVRVKYFEDRGIYFNQYSLRELNQQFLKGLSDRDWQVGRSFKEFDVVKKDVGVSIWLGKIQFSLTDLFVMLPNAIKSKNIGLAVFLVPQKKIAHFSSVTYEQINSTLTELTPLPINYPFVILGYSSDKLSFAVNELTNPINLFLINTIGHTLEDVLLLGEGTYCEFKELLPQNKVLAQEICGFANNKNGGVILIGVSDLGKVIGINSSQLDDLELQITNIVRDSCSPIPEIRYTRFNLSGGQLVLGIQVIELEQKPCLTSGKTYIRVGSSVRIATSEEIRKLILT